MSKESWNIEQKYGTCPRVHDNMQRDYYELANQLYNQRESREDTMIYAIVTVEYVKDIYKYSVSLQQDAMFPPIVATAICTIPADDRHHASLIRAAIIGDYEAIRRLMDRCIDTHVGETDD